VPQHVLVGATGVIIVCASATPTRERLGRAVGSLRKLDVAFVGLVANRSVPSGVAAYGNGSRSGYASRAKR